MCEPRAKGKVKKNSSGGEKTLTCRGMTVPYLCRMSGRQQKLDWQVHSVIKKKESRLFIVMEQSKIIQGTLLGRAS
jgi:hypothetical protein